MEVHTCGSWTDFRQKEAKIRFAAEKAAREASEIKRLEEKKIDQKRREREEKLLNAEIVKLRCQLEKERKSTKGCE